MEVNILNILIPVIMTNSKTVKKVTRAYQHLYPDKKDLPDIKEQVMTVISKKNEAELADILSDSFSPMISQVKADIRFRDFITKKRINPVTVVSNFVLYKTCELLLGKWKNPDIFENKLLGLIYHNIKKTKQADIENTIVLAHEDIFMTMPLLFCLSGSYELFAMLHDIFMRNDISFEEFGRLQLSVKDCKEISYEIAALLDANDQQKDSLPIDSFDRLLVNVKDLTYKSDKQHFQQAYYVSCIATLTKLFIKFFKQKLQEAEKTKPVEPKIIVKEDTETKELLKKKQNDLNKLQIQYDKQKKKIESLQEELNSVSDYVNFIEQAQNFIEKVKEEDGIKKPAIPEGKGVILFGGHPNYQNKMVQQYPWIQVVDPTKSKIDRNILINARCILINWKHLSHQQFYAIMPVIRKYKKEIIYVW